MSATVTRASQLATMVAQDCQTDAAAIDATTFTPRGVGTAFGNTLAMIAALAKAVELLAEEVARRDV